MESDMALPDPDLDPAFYESVRTKRFLAWVGDVTLIAMLCLLLLPFTAFTGILFFPAMMLVVGFVYRWITLANRGATWGMRLMGIGLYDRNGAPIDSGLAFAHTVGYSVSLAMAPLQLISVGAMVATPRGQGLTDMVLDTVMLNRALGGTR